MFGGFLIPKNDDTSSPIKSGLITIRFLCVNRFRFSLQLNVEKPLTPSFEIPRQAREVTLDMEQLQIVIVSSLMGAAVAFLGNMLKSMLDARTKINEALIEKRRELYQKVWSETKLLPKWPKAEDVTYKKLEDFVTNLKDLYYDEVGIYLSYGTRKAYGNLQDTIAEVLEAQQKKGIDSGKKINSDEYETIRKKCSTLRTKMTKDLLSRSGAPHL